jgi:hypothetical protein
VRGGWDTAVIYDGKFEGLDISPEVLERVKDPFLTRLKLAGDACES